MTMNSNEQRAMANRARDWYAQAEKDLALHLHLGQEAWGHVVARILRELPTPAPDDLVDRGMVLDNFYVPSRYPNGHPEGAPFEHYGALQSNEALAHARAIIAFVRAQMAGS